MCAGLGGAAWCPLSRTGSGTQGSCAFAPPSSLKHNIRHLRCHHSHRERSSRRNLMDTTRHAGTEVRSQSRPKRRCRAELALCQSPIELLAKLNNGRFHPPAFELRGKSTSNNIGQTFNVTIPTSKLASVMFSLTPTQENDNINWTI